MQTQKKDHRRQHQKQKKVIVDSIRITSSKRSYPHELFSRIDLSARQELLEFAGV